MSWKCRWAVVALFFAGAAAGVSPPEELHAPVPKQEALFGSMLSLSGDRLAVGAPESDVNGIEEAGEVHIFERQGGAWIHAAQVLPDTPSIKAWFGKVAVQGTRLAVGASREGGGIGALYVFDRDTNGVWVQKVRVEPDQPSAQCENVDPGCHLFAVSVALDGNTVVAGATTEPAGTRYGAVYIVTLDSTGHALSKVRLQPDEPQEGSQFGNDVALDGDTLLVGSHGYDVGNHNGQGAAYVFVREAGLWRQQARLTATDGDAADTFGFSVALDGDRALVAARLADNPGKPRSGAAYVFEREGEAWTQRARLVASDGVGRAEPDGNFGYRVALRGDEAVISRHPGDGNTPSTKSNGSAYHFVRRDGGWIEEEHFTPKTGSPGDGFGSSVDFNNRWIAVGAHHEGSGGNELAWRGAVYVYDRAPVDRIFADDFDED